MLRVTRVTAGLTESNGSLLPGLWHDSLHVTYGLTACTLRSAPGPMLGNEYGKTLLFTFKFYCPHAIADGNQHIRIREKMLEFSSSVSVSVPYWQTHKRGSMDQKEQQHQSRWGERPTEACLGQYTYWRLKPEVSSVEGCRLSSEPLLVLFPLCDTVKPP